MDIERSDVSASLCAFSILACGCNHIDFCVEYAFLYCGGSVRTTSNSAVVCGTFVTAIKFLSKTHDGSASSKLSLK